MSDYIYLFVQALLTQNGKCNKWRLCKCHDTFQMRQFTRWSQLTSWKREPCPGANPRFEDKSWIMQHGESGRVCQGWLLNHLHGALVMEKLRACEPQPTLKTECSQWGFRPLSRTRLHFPLSLIICASGYPKSWGRHHTTKSAVDHVAYNHVHSRRFSLCACMGRSSCTQILNNLRPWWHGKAT